MFKLRRRAAAAVAGSDLPYCAMCQRAIRVEATTGRCALGHRAAAPAPAVTAAQSTAAADATEALDDGTDAAAPHAYDAQAYDPYDTIVYGRSDYDYGNTDGAPVTWDTPAADPTADAGALQDYAAWGEPGDGLSALDVDTQQLPAAPAAAQAPAASASELFDELDELDDATHARRKAVGTIGATMAVSAVVFAAIAALPF